MAMMPIATITSSSVNPRLDLPGVFADESAGAAVNGFSSVPMS
jgi:hypothetical protein